MRERYTRNCSMLKSLSHIPDEKTQELHIIKQHICQQFAVEMIILFGSYARGNWVEEYAENSIHFQYQSDFDLLVLVETRSISEQHRLEQKLEEAIDHLSNIHTPVSIIVHDIGYVNALIAKAQYFFSDIKREGILLYDSGKFKLEKVRHLNPKERYYLAQEDFEHYFGIAKKFMLGFEFYLQQAAHADVLSISAFLLHQITENLYKTVLLVYTRYKPKTHDLRVLRKLVNALEPHLIKIFSDNDQKDRHFELLRRAYIDSRYNKDYSISLEELYWLNEQVKNLTQLVETICQKKIESFNKCRQQL